MRLRSKHWIRQAEGLYDAICEEQERLNARYGDAVKRHIDLSERETTE